MKVVRFSEPIYSTSWMILIGDPDEAEAYISKQFAFSDDCGLPDDGLERCEGVAMQGRPINGLTAVEIIWMPSWNSTASDVGTLAHEITHLVDNLFDEIGMPIQHVTREPHAYFVGWAIATAVAHLDRACRPRKRVRQPSKNKRRS